MCAARAATKRQSVHEVFSKAAPADVQVVLVPQSVIAIPDPAAAAHDIALVSFGWSWHELLLTPLKDLQEDLDGRGGLEVFCNCDVVFVLVAGGKPSRWTTPRLGLYRQSLALRTPLAHF